MPTAMVWATSRASPPGPPIWSRLWVDAIWLSPFYVLPMNDAGYDVSDYRDVDPVFGTLSDADTLIAQAHHLGLKVVVELSRPITPAARTCGSRPPWPPTRAAPERDRYIFRDGRGPQAALPPNNWRSVFGGEGWTRVTEPDGLPGQWHLHIFDSTQPDLNWKTRSSVTSSTHILRFWLDAGVDGFRVDVAHGLVKAPGLPDFEGSMHLPDNPPEMHPPMWIRMACTRSTVGGAAFFEGYAVPGGTSADRILCAEAWVQPEERLARYVRPDEMHQAFNFEFLEAPWRARPCARSSRIWRSN